jgi:hypothetical protein
MVRYLLLGLLVLLTACNRWESAPVPNAPVRENVDVSSVVALNTESRWLETTTDSLTMGIMTPEGWFAEAMDGLMLAEHISPVEGSAPTAGILVYIFAPPLNEFTLSDQAGANFALEVLRQVTQMPSHVGRDVSVSDPVDFRWDGHEAAYYLLTGADGTRTLVIGVAVPDLQRLVVANVSVPLGREAALRAAPPAVLDGLTINAITFDGSALQSLPDPLPFPDFSPRPTRAPDATG